MPLTIGPALHTFRTCGFLGASIPSFLHTNDKPYFPRAYRDCLPGNLIRPLPRGENLHLIREHEGCIFMRAGAPTKRTLEEIGANARMRLRAVTIIDLRSKSRSFDDVDYDTQRLSPTREQQLAREHKFCYVRMNVLDSSLMPTVDIALSQGDLLIHCTNGVINTGFALGRYAEYANILPMLNGISPSNFRRGMNFEKQNRN